MAKINQKINIRDEEAGKIRKVWDEKLKCWQYSIADIMEILTGSTDARNYWKVLKNRLKKRYPELVSNCNQLKMLAIDGKFYLNDAAESTTILKIIQIIAPYNEASFRAWFEHNEVKMNYIKKNETLEESLKIKKELFLESDIATIKKISTAQNILTDIFESKEKILVRFFLPGVKTEDILISASVDSLSVKATLNPDPKYSLYKNKLLSEIDWRDFEKIIYLPNLADVENIVATEYQGLITIDINNIDIQKNRFIKINPLK